MDHKPFGYALVSELTGDIIYRAPSRTQCQRYQRDKVLEPTRVVIARDWSKKTEKEYSRAED